ncbi:hypothetical protein [Streptomyces sp. NPDC054834]
MCASTVTGAPGGPSGSRTDLVMERLSGPTMPAALLDGSLGAAEAGAEPACLRRLLHAVPARDSAGPGARVPHLDLHPDNVILTAGGPRGIDWSNAEDGPPGLTDTGLMGTGLMGTGLTEARRRRAANPTMSAREVELLGYAVELVRTLSR